MEQAWNVLVKISKWFWIFLLFTLAIYYYVSYEENELYTITIGSSLLVFLAIRRILLFYNFIGKGNPYLVFIVFLFGSTLPLVSNLTLNHKKGGTILVFYIVVIGGIISTLAKQGKLGVKFKESFDASERKSIKEKKDADNLRNIKTQAQKAENEAKKKAEVIKKEKQKEQYYYCMYCGAKENSIKLLLLNKCGHGQNAGKNHTLYEGTTKSEYICKYCGAKYPTIRIMSMNKCGNGSHAGQHHVPAL